MLLLWLKAFHIAFMVAWFAGIFYFPRLLIYHTQSNEIAVHQQLKIMQRRLLFFITPFAILTTILGIALIAQYPTEWFKQSGWLHAKLSLVCILIAYHAYCFKLLADFKLDKNKRSTTFYRWFNEFPVILLFAIIILAVVKPF